MWVSVAELEILEKFHRFLRLHLALVIPAWVSGKQAKEDQKWLERLRPFDAVVNGANVGLSNGHNFSFLRLNTVVEQLRQISPSKGLSLIILHISRVNGGPAQNPKNRRLIENWKKNGALYATPQDDEMRDHLFQLLGSSFFLRWKEKHQEECQDLYQRMRNGMLKQATVDSGKDYDDGNSYVYELGLFCFVETAAKVFEQLSFSFSGLGANLVLAEN
ncbi:hypothetical protein VNO80_07882 [Phaseolus coccineus]|uniref:PRORP domain-containing protein n=1 Tax=Phaseolus coccineus TaxID=3886 RepID=A0AAN9NP85_PHACN